MKSKVWDFISHGCFLAFIYDHMVHKTLRCDNKCWTMLHCANFLLAPAPGIGFQNHYIGSTRYNSWFLIIFTIFLSFFFNGYKFGYDGWYIQTMHMEQYLCTSNDGNGQIIHDGDTRLWWWHIIQPCVIRAISIPVNM